MKIIFCRHGESLNNTKKEKAQVNDDSELTDQGKDEARALVSLFKEYGVQKVFFSSLRRTAESAEVICGELGIPSQSMDEFKERNWGDWGPQAWAEVSDRLEGFDFRKRYTFVPSNGESWELMEKRQLDGLDKIIEEDLDSVAIITHVGCLRALVPVLKKEDRESKHKEYSLSLGSALVFSYQNGSYLYETEYAAKNKQVLSSF